MKNQGYLPFLKIIRSGENSGLLLEQVRRGLGTFGISTIVLADREIEVLTDETEAALLSSRYDLVMIDNPSKIQTAILVLGDGFLVGREEKKTDKFFCRDETDIQSCLDELRGWLMSCLNKTPMIGCILIGGNSSRMGHPKHLIRDDKNETWLERTVSCLSPYVSNIVISGKGTIPQGLKVINRVADLPGVGGPMAGVGAVISNHPLCSLIVAACDMPDITPESVEWLLSQRNPGRSAVVPCSPWTGMSEPLFAWYDFRCGPLFSELLSKKQFGMHKICRFKSVFQPELPEEISGAWRNVNCPEDLG